MASFERRTAFLGVGLLLALVGRVVWVRGQTASGLAGRAAPARPTAEIALHDLFSRVRPAVAGRRMIGYAATRPPLAGSREDMMCYYLAQYALAPVVVADRADTELVLGAFDSDEDLTRFATAAGYRVVVRYAAGLALLEKVAR